MMNGCWAMADVWSMMDNVWCTMDAVRCTMLLKMLMMLMTMMLMTEMAAEMEMRDDDDNFD